MSTALEEFTELMRKSAKKQVPIQTEWCIVKEVDWDKKTMVAESVINELEYFDILLGLGAIYKKPKVDTKVLIGIIANTNACFLISCEAFEEMIMVSEKSTFVIKEEGFIVQQDNENLGKIISDYHTEFGKLCDEVNKILVSVGTTPNIPVIEAIKLKVTEEIDSRLKQVLKEN